jgi:hypothetical protein
MVMRRCPVGEGPEAAQQRKLLLAKTRYVSEGLGSRQHGEQAKEQNLVKRIDDLARLPVIRQVFEKRKKNRRLRKCRAVAFPPVHRSIPCLESEDADRFSSNPFCHLFLHPIALLSTRLSVANQDVRFW